MRTKTLSRSFARGEITPELFGRVDLQQFQTGLATCRNFITLPHGPAVNRPGTLKVAATKVATNPSAIRTFAYNNQQTFAVEIGAGYFRFYTLGQVLQYPTPAAYNSGTTYNNGDLCSFAGVNYVCISTTPSTGNEPDISPAQFYALPADGSLEIPNPYLASEVLDVHLTQSNDVLTLVHPNHPPAELRRLGAANWAYAPIQFGIVQQAPSPLYVSIISPAIGNPQAYYYTVTAISATTGEESMIGNLNGVANDLTLAGHANVLSWPVAPGAIRYNVYRSSAGVFGYIGQSANAGGAISNSFVDYNYAEDDTISPPVLDVPFTDATTYPSTVAYFEQRRMFAGSTSKPQTFFGTVSGTESNFAYSIPSRDDDRLSFKIASRDGNAIRHMIPLAELILLTAGGEWRVNSNGNGAVTPSNILIQPQTYNGASNVQPCIVNRGIVYAQARGGRVREMLYSWQANGYTSNDISALAPHLFDYYNIVDMAYAKAPYPIVWCVRSDGTLLGLTYETDQQIAAWHRHDTLGGQYESCCVVSENNEDFLYLVVNRTINGVQTRFIERMASRNFTTPASAFYVDCGSTYNGAPATVISGLTYLNGATVNILADGAVMAPRQVVAGQITLDYAASVVQVGLPITAQMQTLPISMQGDSSGQGMTKNINKAWVRVATSSGFLIGTTTGTLYPQKVRTAELMGTPVAPVTKMFEATTLNSTWDDNVALIIQQNDPLPLDVVALVLEVAVGG